MRLTSAAALLISSILTATANACFAPSSIETVFFDWVPTQVDAPVVVEIKVTQIGDPITRNTRDPDDLPIGVAVARAEVLRVIRGKLDQNTITIVAQSSDCDEVLRVGRTGIVAGTLRTSRQGQTRLMLVSHRFQ